MVECGKHLFCGGNLHEVLRDNLERARNYVDQIPESQFLHLGDGDIVEHVYSKFEVIPIEIYEDQKEMDRAETKVDVSHDFRRGILDKSKPCMVPGLRITVRIPFSGNANLWWVKPSRFSTTFPVGDVHTSSDNSSGHLNIIVEQPSDNLGNGRAIEREINETLRDIQSYLDDAKNDVDAHNIMMRSHIQQCTSNRRTRLGNYAEIVKKLDIPLRENKAAPELTPLPMKRKLIKPLPSAPTTKAEPGIRDEDYKHILNVIRHEGCSFEATPTTFLKLDEENLRNIILAHLNGHYEGEASGETFRRKGKTDILIEFDNRAAFVGDCKVWRGQKGFIEAIDQLLGYLTWRDCKAALIVFNRDMADFSSLQAKLGNSLETYPNFISPIKIDRPGEWRVKIHPKEDKSREIILHVFLFDLFVPKKGSE
jgi:hypothetical protein